MRYMIYLIGTLWEDIAQGEKAEPIAIYQISKSAWHTAAKVEFYRKLKACGTHVALSRILTSRGKYGEQIVFG